VKVHRFFMVNTQPWMELRMCPVRQDKSTMSVFAWTDELEKREAARRSMSREDARPFLASRLGLLPGTIENIVRKRVKEPKGQVIDAIRNAFIRELESEIRRCEHEIHMAVQSGSHPHSDEIAQAQTLIAQARELIGN